MFEVCCCDVMQSVHHKQQLYCVTWSYNIDWQPLRVNKYQYWVILAHVQPSTFEHVYLVNHECLKYVIVM